MHVRPNTVILCDEGTLRTWSPRLNAYVPLRNEDSQLLCALQFGRCREVPAEAADRLNELGVLVSDAEHIAYPPHRFRSRSYSMAEHGHVDEADTLGISSRTQLRFLKEAVYAWAPSAPVSKFRQRYDRYLLLTPEASAVLLSFSDPATPRQARMHVSDDSRSEQEFLRHVQTLKAEGLLQQDPQQKTAKTSAFSVQVSQPEKADLLPPGQAEEVPAVRTRLSESASQLLANTFLVLVYYVLVVPLGWMQRIRPSVRRARLQRKESTWVPCHTEGLRDKTRYKLPF